MALLAPGTQWSHKPSDSLPAAWEPRTCGMATRAEAAAVVARKRRREILLVRMGSPSGPDLGCILLSFTHPTCHAVRQLTPHSPRWLAGFDPDNGRVGKGPAGSFDRRAKALVWPRNCWRDRADADPGRWWARFALPTLRDPLLPRAVLGRPDAGHQIVGGVDQRHVGERLGEIAEKALCPRVVFLGQQAEIVAQRQQPLEHRLGFLIATDHRERVREPEAAGQERAFLAGQAVVDPLRPVPQHEPVHHELALDGFDGADDARMGRRQESDLRQQQQRRIEVVRTIGLHEGVAGFAEAALADLVADFLPQRAPALDRPG